MKTLGVLGLAFLLCANSFAVTSQFRGVNWADKRDNFVSDVLVLSGLSLSDNHESAYAIADRIVGQFQEVLGTNSVRMPVNEPTILKAFDMYSGALDAALEHGRVAMGYWGPAQPAGPKNMDDWWKMWAKLVETYGDTFAISMRTGSRNSRTSRATTFCSMAPASLGTSRTSLTTRALKAASLPFMNTRFGT